MICTFVDLLNPTSKQQASRAIQCSNLCLGLAGKKASLKLKLYRLKIRLKAADQLYSYTDSKPPTNPKIRVTSRGTRARTRPGPDRNGGPADPSQPERP